MDLSETLTTVTKQKLLRKTHFITLAASSGKCNVTILRPSVCPVFFSNRNRPRGAYSTRLTRRQHTTQPAYIYGLVLRRLLSRFFLENTDGWLKYGWYPAYLDLHVKQNSAKLRLRVGSYGWGFKISAKIQLHQWQINQLKSAYTIHTVTNEDNYGICEQKINHDKSVNTITCFI